MKEGLVIPAPENVSDEDIKLINKFTKRELKKDEVYVFSMILCDNEIDRDYERFTNESLEKLSNLFVGKTGIFDHDAKSKNQLARIFSCRTESLKKNNSLGEIYSRLLAKAYIPRTKSSEDIILEIDSGIKKEVSIRCLVENNICNICGRNSNSCIHKKGKKYLVDGKEVLCHYILDNPLDAYEWSFVAIPAQVSAGVIKNFSNNKSENCFDIIEKMKSEFNKKGMQDLFRKVQKIENDVKIGQNYVTELRDEVLKYFSFLEPQIENSVIEKMIDSLNFNDLQKLQKIFNGKSFSLIKSQLATENHEDSYRHSEFKI